MVATLKVWVPKPVSKQVVETRYEEIMMKQKNEIKGIKDGGSSTFVSNSKQAVKVGSD